MQTKIGKWGNSLGIRLPKYVVETLNLNVETDLAIAIEEGAIVIKIVESEITLDSLLSQATEPPEAEIDWGKPEGDEIW